MQGHKVLWDAAMKSSLESDSTKAMWEAVKASAQPHASREDIGNRLGENMLTAGFPGQPRR